MAEDNQIDGQLSLSDMMPADDGDTRRQKHEENG